MVTVDPVAEVDTVPAPTIVNALELAVALPEVALIVFAAVDAMVTVALVAVVEMTPVPVMVIALPLAVAVPVPPLTVLIAVDVMLKVVLDPEVDRTVPSPEIVTDEPVIDPELPLIVVMLVGKT